MRHGNATWRTITAAAVCACAWASPAPARAGASALDSILRGLPVYSLSEDSTSVSALLGPVHPGECVVLFFWSTYDRYSREELPAVARFFAERRGDRALHLLTVNMVEMREGADTVKSFLLRQDIDLPVALDPTWESLRSLQRLLVPGRRTAMGMPTLAVLDSEGNVLAYQPGATGKTYDILVKAAAPSRGGPRSPRAGG